MRRGCNAATVPTHATPHMPSCGSLPPLLHIPTNPLPNSLGGPCGALALHHFGRQPALRGRASLGEVRRCLIMLSTACMAAATVWLHEDGANNQHAQRTGFIAAIEELWVESSKMRDRLKSWVTKRERRGHGGITGAGVNQLASQLVRMQQAAPPRSG